MSHSPIIGEDAVAMSSVTKSTFLDPDGETQVEFLVQVPYNWSGETYFHVQVDANNQVYELASKQNNWGVSGKCDFILTPSADFCPYDLVVPNSISSQVPFNISYNVKNVGPNVPTSSMWNDKIYISKKEYFDNLPIVIDESAILCAIEWTRNTVADMYEDLCREKSTSRWNNQNQFDRLKVHVEHKASEWRNKDFPMLKPYDLTDRDCIVSSWLYEYQIFELVRIYKTIDWEKDCILFYGW